jgi:hypothetical protein
MRIRSRLLLLALVLLLPIAHADPDGGVVDVTAAAIGAGAAPAPGRVKIDSCLPWGTKPVVPEVGPIGTLGTMPGSLPEFPGGGSGADGAFVATADATLEGGTYEFTTYVVDPDVTLTYAGPVEIRTTGDMTVSGTIRTTSASAPITIRCAGSLSMTAGRPDIFTVGTESPIDVMVGEDFRAGEASRLKTVYGAIGISAHGLAGGRGVLEFSAGGVETDEGDVTLRARGPVRFIEGRIETIRGSVLLESFEESVRLDAGAEFHVFGAPSLAIEAATRVDLLLGSLISVTTTPVRITAYGGAIVLDGSTIMSTSGGIDLGALTFLGLAGGRVSTHSGSVSVLCPEGSVEVESPSGGGGVASIGSIDGDIDIAAGDDVSVNGLGRIHAWHGSLDIRAGGDFRLTELAGVGNNLIDSGPIDIRGGNAIVLSGAPAIGGFVQGTSIALAAGSEGVGIQHVTCRSTEGPLTVLSKGPIAIDGHLEAAGELRLTSTEDSIDLRDETLGTMTGDPSGSILIDSWAVPPGRIDAAGSTIVSGTSSAASGDVTIGVHVDSKGPPDAVDSFFHGSRFRLALDEQRPERSTLTVAGFCDSGWEDLDLGSPATLTVDDLSIDLPALVPVKGGRVWVHDQDGVTFKVRPSRSKSSRGRFSLKFAGDLGGLVDPDSPHRIRYAGTAPDTPDLYPIRAKATVRGPGRDRLSLHFGLGTVGTPDEASDVRIRFAGRVDVTIPASSFRRRGDAYEFKGDLDGVTSVRLDYARGTVKVKGANLDLGLFPEGPVPVFVGVTVGDDERAVRFRMVRRGSRLRY